MEKEKRNVRQNYTGMEKSRIPDMGFAQSTAESVPIVGVHENYQLLETYKGCYVKSYLIGTVYSFFHAGTERPGGYQLQLQPDIQKPDLL